MLEDKSEKKDKSPPNILLARSPHEVRGYEWESNQNSYNFSNFLCPHLIFGETPVWLKISLMFFAATLSKICFWEGTQRSIHSEGTVRISCKLGQRQLRKLDMPSVQCVNI